MLEETIKKRSAASFTQPKVIAILVSELYRLASSPKFRDYIAIHFDIMVSCDSQAANPGLIVSTTVVVIAMCGEHWLAWLLKVCNYDLPM